MRSHVDLEVVLLARHNLRRDDRGEIVLLRQLPAQPRLARLGRLALERSAALLDLGVDEAAQPEVGDLAADPWLALGIWGGEQGRGQDGSPCSGGRRPRECWRP